MFISTLTKVNFVAKSKSLSYRKMFSIFLLTILGVLIFYYIRRIYLHFTFWQRQGVPAYPFINIEWAFKEYRQLVFDEAKQYGRIFGIYEPASQVLFLNDAKLARELSIKSFHQFPIRFNFYTGTTNIGKSLFFLEADENWRRIRSVVTPAFTTGKLKQMLTPIERITSNFIDHLKPMAESGERFDMKKFIGSFAMDTIATAGYGIHLDSLSDPNHPVVVNAKKVLNVDASFSMVVSTLFPWLAKLLKLEPFDKKAVQFFDDLTSKIIEQRLASDSAKQNSDLLGLMIEESQNYSDKDVNQNNTPSKFKGLSPSELSGQGILFFIAGYDTTSATLLHVIYFLTQHPEWQEKLYQEVYKMKDNLDYDNLKKMPILNGIINETLRLCPPLLEFHRVAKEDCTLLDTGIKIPKGTSIAIRPQAIHFDPEYFDEPAVFNPERQHESNIAFMPFGVGNRLCVGMRFAQNELRIGIANFVLNYKCMAEKNLKLEYFRGSILLSPKNLMISITERVPK